MFRIKFSSEKNRKEEENFGIKTVERHFWRFKIAWKHRHACLNTSELIIITSTSINKFSNDRIRLEIGIEIVLDFDEAKQSLLKLRLVFFLLIG